MAYFQAINCLEVFKIQLSVVVKIKCIAMRKGNTTHTYLVVIVKQLYDTTGSFTVVLDRYDPHDIWCVLPCCSKASNYLHFFPNTRINVLLGSSENLSHITRTAAAFSAQTLCKSIALSMVPYNIQVFESAEYWRLYYNMM